MKPFCFRHRDSLRQILMCVGTQQASNGRILKIFGMWNCSPCSSPALKGNEINLDQLKREKMKNISCTSMVGNLEYAQVCRPDITLMINMLVRVQSYLGVIHQKATRKSTNNVKGTKGYMLMYKRFDHLEVVGHSDSHSAGCVDSRKLITGYLFLLAGSIIFG